MNEISHGEEIRAEESDRASHKRQLAEAIVQEYALVQAKRSKLSRAQRERVVKVYPMAVATLTEKEGT